MARGRGESEHVQAIYTAALEAEGLLSSVEARMVAPNADELLPVLLAVSDIHDECALLEPIAVRPAA